MMDTRGELFPAKTDVTPVKTSSPTPRIVADCFTASLFHVPPPPQHVA